MQLIVLAAIFGAASAAVFHSPLLWRRSEKVEMIAKGKYADYRAKLESLRKVDATGVLFRIFSTNHNWATRTIPVLDMAYNVLFDDVDNNISMQQVNSVRLEGFNSTVCDQMKKFDPDNSTTFISFIDSWKSAAYGGFASGQKMGSDEMRLGGVHESQQFILRAQFGMATKLNVTQVEIPYDGAIGLAFGEYNNSKGFPFISNAIEKGNFDKPVFTIWLKPYPVVGDSGGVITYGDIDTYNCGPVIQYENITSDIAYIYTINRISMGTRLYRMRFDVEVHLGSFILGPGYIVDLFAKDAGVEIGDDGEYYIDCDAKFNSLEIECGNITYNISYENLIIQVDDDTCLFAISPWEQISQFRPTWYIGAPLLRQYCAVFDIEKRRIGFAEHLPDDQKSSTIRRTTPSLATLWTRTIGTTMTSAGCGTRLAIVVMVLWQFS